MAGSFGMPNPADLASNMQVRMGLCSSTSDSIYSLSVCSSPIVHCHCVED